MPKLLQVPQINLRMMSLNMQYGSGPEDNERNLLMPIPKREIDHNLDQIVDLVLQINPDVICLQEADRESSRTEYMNQPEEIAKRLSTARLDHGKYNVAFGSCVDLDEERWGRISRWARSIYGNKRYEWLVQKLNIEPNMIPNEKIKIHFGNAIISPYPLREVWHQYYVPPSWRPIMDFRIIRRIDERKSFIRCQLDYHPEIQEKVPLYVINTHFECKNEKNREQQSKILYKELHERSGSHNVLLGDFNAEPLNPEIDIEKKKIDAALERLLRHPNTRHFQGVHGDPACFTYPSWKPTNLFDTIITSKYVEIESYYVHPQRVSDHLAVVAEIKINPDLVPENTLRKLLTAKTP